MSKFTKFFVWPKKGYKWNPKGLKNCRGLWKIIFQKVFTCKTSKSLLKGHFFSFYSLLTAISRMENEERKTQVVWVVPISLHRISWENTVQQNIHVNTYTYIHIHIYTFYKEMLNKIPISLHRISWESIVDMFWQQRNECYLGNT